MWVSVYVDSLAKLVDPLYKLYLRFPADFDNYANNASRACANISPQAVQNPSDNVAPPL